MGIQGFHRKDCCSTIYTIKNQTSDQTGNWWVTNKNRKVGCHWGWHWKTYTKLENTTSHRRYAIFTHSLSTIQNFAANKSQNRPNLFTDTTEFLQKLSSHITLIWVPSHVGIPGNERADRLANSGTQRHHVDIDIGLEVPEAQNLATKYINTLWQQHWNNTTTGRHLYNLQPTIYIPHNVSPYPQD